MKNLYDKTQTVITLFWLAEKENGTNQYCAEWHRRTGILWQNKNGKDESEKFAMK